MGIETEGAATGDEEGFDTESALQSISEGLGFNADSNEDEGEGGSASAPTPAPAAAPAPSSAAPTAAPTPAPTPEQALATPPKTWRPEAAAAFAALPPAVRAEIHKREEDMHRGLQQYRSAAQFGQSMHQAVRQYMPLLQQHGIDPARHVGNLMSSHHLLATGSPEAKVRFVAQMVKDYGIDAQALAASFNPDNAPYVDPAVSSLTQTVQSLQSKIAQQEQRAADATRSTLKQQIDAFAKEPGNIYFDEVANDMALMIGKGLASSLRDAYDKAVWANPVTRQREIARATKERAEADRKAAEQRAAAARRAKGANVRTTQKNGSATAPLGSIDDTLRETMSAIRARG